MSEKWTGTRWAIRCWSPAGYVPKREGDWTGAVGCYHEGCHDHNCRETWPDVARAACALDEFRKNSPEWTYFLVRLTRKPREVERLKGELAHRDRLDAEDRTTVAQHHVLLHGREALLDCAEARRTAFEEALAYVGSEMRGGGYDVMADNARQTIKNWLHYRITECGPEAKHASHEPVCVCSFALRVQAGGYGARVTHTSDCPLAARGA